MENKKPTVLVILDGFGYRKEKEANAIAQANTPNLTHWFATYPHTLLQASGTAVGLLDGYVGNSEVGHTTIGAGRIIPQAITVVQNAIANKSFFNNKLLVEHLQKLPVTDATLHLMGLLSDGGVHSNMSQLFAFLDAAVAQGIKKIVVHPFLDGRDAPPQSAHLYLSQLAQKLKQLSCGTIGTIHGRFYAMDRDRNWQRTQESYNAMTTKHSNTPQSWQTVLQEQYANGITDEFIPPTQLDPEAMVKSGDGVIFFNIRPDRARQITRCFVDPTFTAFPVKKLPLTFFITPVSYDGDLKTTVLFSLPPMRNTLKDILAAHGKTMFTIAETEKYAHVTYFFAGGREEIMPNEVRILVPSIPAKNYIALPEMSAPQITTTVLASLEKTPKDFYLINYANADMVGHSGNFQATVKAVECLDSELKKLYDVVIDKLDGTLIVTADHGNAELKVDPVTHQPHTAHTTSPVPFLVIQKELANKKIPLALTQLADIAPFILQHMQLPLPAEMNRPLITK